MNKNPVFLYKTLLVGIIVLVIGVGIQPSMAVRQEKEIDIVQAPPTIEFLYEPLGGNCYTGWWCRITVMATDQTSGMNRLEIYFNDELIEIIYSGGSSFCMYEWEFKYPPIPNITIKAIAYDNAGNSASDSLNLRDLDLNRHSRDNLYNNYLQNDFFKEKIHRFTLFGLFLQKINFLR
jgi:hypothetical protein